MTHVPGLVQHPVSPELQRVVLIEASEQEYSVLIVDLQLAFKIVTD
jgi:hypothetical protein